MNNFERKVDRTLELLERWEASQSDVKSLYGKGLTIIPCRVTWVSENGHKILVSPLDGNDIHEAFPLSPIPTTLEEGLRIQGIPVEGDTALCAILDRNWYILGYYNLPDALSAEKVTYAGDYERLSPFKHGVLWKISRLGQIIFRKSNWIKLFFGEWASFDIRGESFVDKEREPMVKTVIPNLIHKTWGGISKWTRKKDDTRREEWKTTHLEVSTKSFEPDAISDIKLDKKVKNEDIDDTQDPMSIQTSNPPANAYNLPYIDKVIKRAGTIGDETHVYEREVRQSIEEDNEKTGFTTLKEGYRDGVLREYITENVLNETTTIEKLGEDANGILKYYKGVNSEGNILEIQQDKDGYRITTSDGGDNNSSVLLKYDGNAEVTSTVKIIVDSPEINISSEADTELVRWDGMKAWLDALYGLIKDHDHNTGVGPSSPASGGTVSTTLFSNHETKDATSLEENSKSTITKVK